MEQSLQTQASLQALVARFVPLKIGYTGAGDAGKWAQLYPSEGNSIPKVFVVRADGQPLYGKSGAPDPLAGFLQQQLAAAGTILTAAQLDQLAAQVEKAKKLLDEGDVPKALAAITRLTNTGTFAEPAVAAAELLKRITSDGQAAVKRATESLEKNDSADSRLVALASLVETSRQYAKVPEVAKAAHVALRDFRKDKESRELVKQAELIDAANDLERKKQAARAVAKFQQISKDFPDTPAARLAQERIAALEKLASAESKPADGSGATAETKTAALRTAAVKSTKSAASVTDEKRAASMLRMAQSLADVKPEKAREYAEKANALAPEGGAVAKAVAELLKSLEQQ